jgi:hypothetical protein
LARLPRSASRLLLDTLALYRRYSLLFLVLAAAVVVPYETIVLAITGAGPFARGSLDFQATTLLTLVDLALVSPLVSALHVHAVREVRAGGDPEVASIARQGLRVLPVVAVVSVTYGIGTTLGTIALIVPGVYLMLRWAVAAQAAAIEREGWRRALRRSGELAGDNYGHVFVVIVSAGVITGIPVLLIALAFGHDSTDAASFLVGTAVQVVAYSFGALITALLYYDLRLRWELAPDPATSDRGTPNEAAAPSEAPVRASSWDPRDYAPEDRPKGWYIDPKRPRRMRYWGEGDPPDWGRTSVRTPGKILRSWEGGDG